MPARKRQPKKVVKPIFDDYDDLGLIEVDEIPVKRTRKRKPKQIDTEERMRVVKKGLDAGYQVADLVFSIISLFK